MLSFLLAVTVLSQPTVRVLVAKGNIFSINIKEGNTNFPLPFPGPWQGVCEKGVLTFANSCGNTVSFPLPFTLSSPSQGMELNDKRYDYPLTFYTHDKGCTIVTTLPLEEYLKGVIPEEMGPSVYPSLEALKAQAVAARSYALYFVENPLDPHYDLCATPACQAYGGEGNHHPLSNQAVEETEGLILTYDGDVVPAFYTATCGGHSAPAELLTHTLPYPYQPCFPLPHFSLTEEKPSFSFDHLVAQLLQPFSPPPAISSFWGELRERDKVEMLKTMGFLKEIDDYIVRLDGRHLYLLKKKQPLCLPLEYELWEGEKRTSSLLLFAGERVKLWVEGDTIRKLQKIHRTREASACRNAPRFRWKQFLSWDTLQRKTGLKPPIHLQVLEQDPEGRILALKVKNHQSEKVLKGLAIRFTLGIPEIYTTFYETPLGVWFFGKGWGHGVGLCQEGAFGMAVSGYDFYTILRYYYPNFTLHHW